MKRLIQVVRNEVSSEEDVLQEIERVELEGIKIKSQRFHNDKGENLTVLGLACQRDSENAVRAIISKVKNLNSVVYGYKAKEMTAIGVACQYNSLNALKVLKENGLGSESGALIYEDKTKVTALGVAVKNNLGNVVESLLDGVDNINPLTAKIGRGSITAIGLACTYGAINAVEALIKFGVTNESRAFIDERGVEQSVREFLRVRQGETDNEIKGMFKDSHRSGVSEGFEKWMKDENRSAEDDLFEDGDFDPYDPFFNAPSNIALSPILVDNTSKEIDQEL